MNNLFFHIKLAVTGLLISLHIVSAPVAPAQTVIAPAPIVQTDDIDTTVVAPAPAKTLAPRSVRAVEHIAPVTVTPEVDDSESVQSPAPTVAPVSAPAATVQQSAPQVIYVQVPQSAPANVNPLLPQPDANAQASVTLYDVVPQAGSPFQERTALSEDDLRSYAINTASYMSVQGALQNDSIDDVISYLNDNGFTVTTE